MITVEEAENLISQQQRDYGNELLPFEGCMGRVLAENIIADRDLPPFNRATMDGIAINSGAFKNDMRSFRIKGILKAGESPIELSETGECVEIMTGAYIPATTDTVIRYEDLEIRDSIAFILTDEIKKGQNIHFRGCDRKQNDILVPPGVLTDATVLGMAASTGSTRLAVKKTPRVVIISTGDELIDPSGQPKEFEIRRSNSYVIRATLSVYSVHAEVLHLPDNLDFTIKELQRCLSEFDILLITGAVSMGKFDYVPEALKKLSVTTIFHKVKQRPGKPFWFGSYKNEALVFAFPGNPVSTFMCLHRYFLPWLKKTLGMEHKLFYAILGEDFQFTAALKYFLQVQLTNTKEGHLFAIPVAGNGSGDFSSLAISNAFMELPSEQNTFNKGNVFPVWPFKMLI